MHDFKIQSENIRGEGWWHDVMCHPCTLARIECPILEADPTDNSLNGPWSKRNAEKFRVKLQKVAEALANEVGHVLVIILDHPTGVRQGYRFSFLRNNDPALPTLLVGIHIFGTAPLGNHRRRLLTGPGKYCQDEQGNNFPGTHQRRIPVLRISWMWIKPQGWCWSSGAMTKRDVMA